MAWKQMGLAQPAVAVNEERIIGSTRGFSDGLGCRMGQAVRRSGHEGLEDELGVELHRRRLAARRFGWGGPGRSGADLGWGGDAEKLLQLRFRLGLLHLEAPRTGEPTSLAKVSSIMGR